MSLQRYVRVSKLTPGLVHKGQGKKSSAATVDGLHKSSLHVSSHEAHITAPGKPGHGIPEAVCKSPIAQPAPTPAYV